MAFRDKALCIEKFRIAVVAHPEFDVRDLREAIAVIEALRLGVLAIDRELDFIRADILGLRHIT